MNKLIASTTIKGHSVRLYANVSATSTYAYNLWRVGKTVAIRGTMLPKVASVVRTATDEHSLIEGVISLLSGRSLTDAQSVATPQLTIAETPCSDVVPSLTANDRLAEAHGERCADEWWDDDEPQLDDAKFVDEANAELLEYLKLDAISVAASVKVGEHRFNDPADAERFMLTAIDLGYDAEMYPADDITPTHRFSDSWGVSVTDAKPQQYADHYIADDDSESHTAAISALQAELDRL